MPSIASIVFFALGFIMLGLSYWVIQEAKKLLADARQRQVDVAAAIEEWQRKIMERARR